MDKNIANKGHHATDTMLKEKTNQDFNKQKPDPNDPNQKKNQPEGKDEEREKKGSVAKDRTGDISKEALRKEEDNKGSMKKNEGKGHVYTGNKEHQGADQRKDGKSDTNESGKGK